MTWSLPILSGLICSHGIWTGCFGSGDGDAVDPEGGILCPPTSSQNHRMVGVGRDLCGSSSPNPLLKQGHLEQGAQDLVQAGLEYLQRRRFHNFPGQPVPVLHHLQSEEVLPHVQLELPLLQFVPVAPSPVTGQH